MFMTYLSLSKSFDCAVTFSKLYQGMFVYSQYILAPLSLNLTSLTYSKWLNASLYVAQISSDNILVETFILTIIDA